MLVGNSATASTVQVLPIINVVQQLSAISSNAAGGASQIVKGNTQGAITGNNNNTGNTGNPPNNPNAPPPGVPTAPPGTIVPSGGGYLTPDGFVYTSFSTNGSGGPGPGPTYASLVAQATLSDATISTPTLDNNPDMAGSRVFTKGVEVTIPTTADFSGFADAGYFARNLTITTPSINFSPYTDSSFPDFVFFGSESLTIVNNLSLSAFPTELVFFTGGTLSISPGVTITGNSTFLEFGSRNALNLTSVSIMNTGGDISLDSFSTLTLNNCSLTASSVNGNTDISIGNGGTLSSSSQVTLNNTLLTASSIDVFSGAMLTISGTTPAAGQINGTSGIFLDSTSGATVGVNLLSDPQNGNISMNNSSGLLTVNNGAQLTASSINLDSGDDILVDSIAPPAANSINLTAGGTATMQNTDMSNVGALNVNAHTVVLMNFALPNNGSATFTVANGVLAPNPNTSAGIVPGDLNFIKNVTYQGALANNGQGYRVFAP